MRKGKQIFGALRHRKGTRPAFPGVLLIPIIYFAKVMAIPGDLPGKSCQDILLPGNLSSVHCLNGYTLTGRGKAEPMMPKRRKRKTCDKIVSMNTVGKDFLAGGCDTVTCRMIAIKKALGEVYQERGDYRNAVHCHKQLAVLYDSLYKWERQRAAMVPAAVFGIHEKDRPVRHRFSTARAGRMWLIGAGCFLFLSGIILGFVLRYKRKIRVKNHAWIETNQELLRYKDELCRKQDENRALQEQIRLLRRKPEEPVPEKVFNKTGSGKMEKAAKDMAGKTERGEITVKIAPEKRIGDKIYNKALFEQVDYLIQSKRLYLDPDFSRDKLAAYIYIPRNRFAPFIKQYAGISFTKYLNNLRLEFAARLLIENPHYSIGAIAEDCGIPASTTFYTLFVERFNVTPSNF